jgi:hypothetical protein
LKKNIQAADDFFGLHFAPGAVSTLQRLQSISVEFHGFEFGGIPPFCLTGREFNPASFMPMPKKKKPSATPDDPLSRKALQDAIKELLEKNFAPWNTSPDRRGRFANCRGVRAGCERP